MPVSSPCHNVCHKKALMESQICAAAHSDPPTVC